VIVDIYISLDDYKSAGVFFSDGELLIALAKLKVF